MEMTQPTRQWRRLWPYFAIGLLALVGHGLLLLNNGTYWDGWPIKNVLETGTWHDEYQWASETGLPMFAYFFWGLKLAGLVAYTKFVAFFSIFASAILIYRICLRFGWLTRYEALGIALLCLVYPAYQTAVTIATLQYECFYCLFLFAILGLIYSEEIWRAKRARFAFRAVTLVLLFISFSLNSLLVFYFPLLFLVFLHAKQQRQLSWSGWAKNFLPRRIDLFVVPFLYWGSKIIFFPVHGQYQGYNTIHLSVIPIVARMFESIKTGGWEKLKVSVIGLYERPILWVVVMLLAYFAYTKLAATDSTVPTHFEVERESRKSIWIFLFGMLLLLSAVFPYSAVGDVPTLHGWNTRHALLIALPIAILIMAALRTLWIYGPYHGFGRGFDGRLFSALIGVSLLTAFTLSTIDYYVGWQIRAIKDRAIMTELAAAPALRKFSVFWIDDRFPAGGARVYRFYEWAGMFKKIWGGESRIGLQIQGYGYNPEILKTMKGYYTKRNMLSELNAAGCQVGLRILRGPARYTEGELVRRYFEDRFLHKQDLPNLLHQVVHLNVVLFRDQKKNCSLDFR